MPKVGCAFDRSFGISRTPTLFHNSGGITPVRMIVLGAAATVAGCGLGGCAASSALGAEASGGTSSPCEKLSLDQFLARFFDFRVIQRGTPIVNDLFKLRL